MKYIELPIRADDPIHLLLWGADELVPILGGLIAGMIFGEVKIFLFVGFLFTYFYKKFRDSHADGYFIHLLYWYGVIPTKKYKSFKNPFDRRFLP